MIGDEPFLLDLFLHKLFEESPTPLWNSSPSLVSRRPELRLFGKFEREPFDLFVSHFLNFSFQRRSIESHFRESQHRLRQCSKGLEIPEPVLVILTIQLLLFKYDGILVLSHFDRFLAESTEFNLQRPKRNN